MFGNLTINTAGDLISESEYTIVMESCYIVWIVLSLLGVISNVINIKIFVSMGINDGIIVSFLALAIFDLTYLVASLSLAVTVALYVCELKLSARFRLDPFAVLAFVASVMILINITNVLTTTFLAVARCMCVARPLQFKNTFTKRRAINFMVGFSIFAAVMYLPILANMGVRDKPDKLTNISRFSLWFSPVKEEIKNNIWMVTEIFLPVATQFIILVCVVVMARSLRAASKFRQSSNTVINKLTQKSHKNRNCNQSENSTDGPDPNSSTDKLTGKDLRVVQQVVLISMVYAVCNVPKIIISFYAIMEPEFAIGRRYIKLYLSAHCLRKHFEIVNAAVNFIIYYKYNTKFRSTLGL